MGFNSGFKGLIGTTERQTQDLGPCAVDTRTRTHIHIYTHTHTRVCVCMYVCVCACACARVYGCVCVCLYMYLCIYVYWRMWGVPCEPAGQISSSCNVIWSGSLSKNVTESGRNWVAQGDASDLFPEDTVFESWLELSRFRWYVVFFPITLFCLSIRTFKYSTTISQYARIVITWWSSHVFPFLSSVAVGVFFLACNAV